MASPRKAWKAEYAKSSRSSCKTCKSPISKDALRLGKMVVATQFDGFMPMWNHASCILKKANQIKMADDVESIDLLRWEDQQKIRAYVEKASSSTENSADTKCTIEVAKSSRSSCRHCNEKIMKGVVRISLKPEGQGLKRLAAWYHVKCFTEVSPSTAPENLLGLNNLSDEDREEVLADIADSRSKKDPIFSGEEGKPREAPSRGTKRRKLADEHNLNPLKAEDDASIGEISKKRGEGNLVQSDASGAVLKAKLKEQTKALWDIKDELKKNVTSKELREMLEANEQDSRGSEYDLRERCADGMLFGVLEKCPLCSGSFVYSGGQYSCHGYLSAWSKCSCSTTEPQRLQKKWRIPKGCNNQYLCKWFDTQKAKKPLRVLPPVSSKSPRSPSTGVYALPFGDESLGDLKVAISGVFEEILASWKVKLESAGCTVHPKIKKDSSCMVVGAELNNVDPEIKKARRMKIPIVRENYLVDCLKSQKKLHFDKYRIEPTKEATRSGTDTVTVKVKGRSAVHESSGLQDSGHVLEDGKSIYNTTLNMSDLTTGVNSYYILQVIEEDKGSDCYVFRKWGRVGNDRIGGNKLEEMSKDDAVKEFKRLFLEKTGNPWEAWEQKKNFEKQPGRFFPLDIDYGVKKLPQKKERSNETSMLAPQLVDLMKMLFNVETYRAAMMEFEINMAEMPLGKLSKQNIQKGFEALTEIQNLLNDNDRFSPAKESMIVDASNRFFTLIPSIHPHVIRDEYDFQMKVKMLEALQDIEIASRIVGFDSESDDSLDDKYKKLNCDILPLPHDAEDFKLIKNYLLNTHAPTHKDCSLELEEVFALDRDGEVDKYAIYRDKLLNKMLLWHGSRLTNFVGILSQGLRIAPPEAPATGYMFGKGIYFADLVSKSAQYCYVDKSDPVGLLLLSEVALGEIYELKKASYMDKPPKGKHSTKGLGKTVPLESQFVKWKDDVTVPCGKPVSSSVRASELLYNEYIVYNTSQVKMQFLLKVRFHHKR